MNGIQRIGSHVMDVGSHVMEWVYGPENYHEIPYELEGPRERMKFIILPRDSKGMVAAKKCWNGNKKDPNAPDYISEEELWRVQDEYEKEYKLLFYRWHEIKATKLDNDAMQFYEGKPMKIDEDDPDTDIKRELGGACVRKGRLLLTYEGAFPMTRTEVFIKRTEVLVNRIEEIGNRFMEWLYGQGEYHKIPYEPGTENPCKRLRFVSLPEHSEKMKLAIQSWNANENDPNAPDYMTRDQKHKISKECEEELDQLFLRWHEIKKADPNNFFLQACGNSILEGHKKAKKWLEQARREPDFTARISRDLAKNHPKKTMLINALSIMAFTYFFFFARGASNSNPLSAAQHVYSLQGGSSAFQYACELFSSVTVSLGKFF